MQTQPKYQSEVTTVVMEREVEQKLFDVFSKYAGQRV